MVSGLRLALAGVFNRSSVSIAAGSGAGRQRPVICDLKERKRGKAECSLISQRTTQRLEASIRIGRHEAKKG